MARRHRGLPRPKSQIIQKKHLLDELLSVDSNPNSVKRILTLETNFRARISSHIDSMPVRYSKFRKFNTSPFVLMMHTFKRGYAYINEIEKDILPAKEFSSMETSAGRMVEDVMLPVYSWENVESEMHTCNSALDGKKFDGQTLKLATLKSGPRCLNDEMSENFADTIINYAEKWARDAGSERIDFTYGVLYGTKKLSNKKDWHILRNIRDKVPADQLLVSPDGKWNCSFNMNGIRVDVTIRIGTDWWNYLGGNNCFIELCVALIRACVRPAEISGEDETYTISDLPQIVSTAMVPGDYNVSILQRSQLEWLFFLARHFCDEIK